MAFLHGELSAMQIDVLEAHLESCGACVASLAELASTSNDMVGQIRRDVEAAPEPSDPRCEAALRRFERIIASPEPATTTSPARVRCPHCRQRLEVMADSSGEVACPSCGSKVEMCESQSTQTSRQPPYECVGRYKLLEFLGAGAFGSVWRARDMQLDRDVAVKLPRSGRLAEEGSEERFLREARSAAQLKHPSIVSIHDVGRHEELVYIVSDLVRGISLADWLTARKPSFRESAELAAQVAEALHYAHSHGVVHRDLKPSNIMLAFDSIAPELVSQSVTAQSTVNRPGSTDGGPQRGADAPTPNEPLSYRPRIMDFGLAKRDAGEVTVTFDGQILGTPAYMSPEQIRDPHTVDGRGDLYSLGVILYELLTGELPFRGVTRMVLHQALHEEPRAPRKLNDRIPRDLETITLKCLAKESGRRYATGQALADDLQRYLRGEPIQARPVGPAGRTWRWCRRNPVVAGLIAAVLAVTLTGLVATRAQAVAAISARDKADQVAEVAMDTLRTLVVDVGEGLDNFPQGRTLKLQVLDKAGRDIDRLVAVAGDRPGTQKLQITRNRLKGDVYFARFDFPAASAAYGQAFDLAKSAEAGDLNVDEALAALHLGRLHNQQRAWSEARNYLSHALELFQSLAEQHSADNWIERNRILALYSLSLAELKLGNRGQALKLAQDGVAGAERFASQPETKWLGDIGIASGMPYLAAALNVLGRGPEARSSMERAIAIHDRTLSTSSDNYVAMYERSIAHHEYGKILENQSDLTGARKQYIACLTDLRAIASSDPGAANLFNHQALIEVAQKLGTIAGSDGQAFYEAARGYALAASLLVADMDAADKLPTGLRTVYYMSATSAFELLRRARGAGYFADNQHIEALKSTSEFELLKQDPNYEPFVQSLGRQ